MNRFVNSRTERMVIILPFHGGDQESATTWLSWAEELGGCKSHSIILMPAKGVNSGVQKELAARAFGSVSILPDAEGIEGHPAGPNSMMRQAIWHCQINSIGPWTFMEPDCIPLVPVWMDQWEMEYRAHGKPFMGELRPAHDVTPDYLTGNMVLPANALTLAPMLARKGLSRDGVELAFDIVAASQTLPYAHLTKLLQQMPKNADGSSISFPDFASLGIIRDGAILFHPCKDGSLVKQLRARKQSRGELDSSQSHKLTPAGSIPAPAIPVVLERTPIDEQVMELRARIVILENIVLDKPDKFSPRLVIPMNLQDSDTKIRDKSEYLLREGAINAQKKRSKPIKKKKRKLTKEHKAKLSAAAKIRALMARNK